ncbi:RES family NAD+ phosphorylase [Marinobacter shengliensis]|uniref:RES family NAD+ phosphorylase n=1 Tax=Marinobacter shengliensis TaxID=1389223 RepID=UPI0011082F39|nr:RES family NAD+ phosphorylase [Marinobacter shengliensis]
MSYAERIESCIERVAGKAYRVAESQEQVATTDIVDSAAKQSRLEELLEETKPPYPTPGDGIHYLLKTPFRYPPLKHGSRFGKVTQKSLFYGAANTQTALAETAFYRLVFVVHGKKPFPKPVRSQHTIFEVRVDTERGVRLQGHHWLDVREQMVDPVDYTFTQKLGTELREAKVEAFQFISARAVQAGMRSIEPSGERTGVHNLAANVVGINWGIFTQSAFAEREPSNPRQLIGVTTREKASFVITERNGSSSAVEFSLEDFLVEGELPRPAA